MSESLAGDVVDTALVATGVVVGVPVAIITVVGIIVGSAQIVQQGVQNGDTTLNLFANRGRPCSAYPSIGEELGDIHEAQKLVNEAKTTDAVCYVGQTAEGAVWYSTGKFS